MLNRLKTTYNYYTHMSFNILTGTTSSPAGTAPTGSIAPYIGSSGYSDPSGWVICDGVGRINSGGIYDRVIALSIGSYDTNTNTYTPPDLKARYLRGTGTSPIVNLDGVIAYIGSALNTFQDQKLKNHDHSYPSHAHTVLNTGDTYLALGFNPLGGLTPNTIKDATTGNLYNLVNNYYLAGGSTAVSTSSVTLSNANSVYRVESTIGVGSEIRAYGYGVNWILKL